MLAIVCVLSSRVTVDNSIVGIESFSKVLQFTVGAVTITPKAVATHLSRKGCPTIGRLSISMKTANSKGIVRCYMSRYSLFNLRRLYYYLVKM